MCRLFQAIHINIFQFDHQPLVTGTIRNFSAMIFAKCYLGNNPSPCPIHPTLSSSLPPDSITYHPFLGAHIPCRHLSFKPLVPLGNYFSEAIFADCSLGIPLTPPPIHPILSPSPSPSLQIQSLTTPFSHITDILSSKPLVPSGI